MSPVFHAKGFVMSKETQRLSEILKPPEQSMGAVTAEKEGIQAALPGLSLSKILSDVGTELKQQWAHGAHEMSAALFNGTAFVMYPRNDSQREDPQHGLPPIEAVKQPEAQQEQSRGGMEM
jgi:hypothetical protein